MTIATPSERFARSLSKLAKHYKSLKNDYEEFLKSIKQDPWQGNQLGHNLRKVRMAIASKGKGKSGGARVITYTIDKQGDDIIIHLLDIYDKSERETMKEKELVRLLAECGLC